MLHSSRVYTDPSLQPLPCLSVVTAQTPLASAHVDLSRTCTAYEPLSDPLSSSPVACDGSTSPWQAATRRTVDPYETCRCQLDHFVQLQEEQIALMQQLQQSLTSYTATGATAVGAKMSDNAENVHPDALQDKGHAAHDRSTLPQQQKSRLLLNKSALTDHLQRTPDGEGHHSLSATPASIVYRLRVLQHESAELASTRCYPALTHLFSTFDAYWTWKQTNMGNVNRRDVSAHQTPQERQAARCEGDGGGEKNGSVITDCSASSFLSPSCTSSLRQRYDHAVHVRDELESFLQLHHEAVRALQPYLQKWLQTFTTARDIKSPSYAAPLHDQRQREKKERGAQHDFALYAQELLEVAHTVRHVACLLLTALAALCRPSPRLRDSRSDSINTASSRCRTPATSANVQGLFGSTVEAVTALQAGVVSELGETTLCQRGKSTPAEQGTAMLLTSLMQGEQKRVSTSNDVMPSLASSRTTAPLSHSPKAAARTDDAWAAALSPLTPQPHTSATKTAPAEAVRGEPAVSQTSPASSPSPSPSPRLVSPSQEGREQQQRSRRSAEASLSTAAAVSLSPLTAARHERTVRDTVRRSGRGSRSRSPSTPPFTQLQGHEEHPDGVPATAAVSPAVVAPKELDKRDKEHHEKGGSGGVRSLLMELTSAQNDDGATSRAASMPSASVQKFSATSFKEAKEREEQRDEEVVVHVPEEELRSVSPREPEEHTRIGRSRSCSSAGASITRSAGREESGEAGSVGRAASIPSVWWPRLMSTAAARDSSSSPSGTAASEAAGEVGDVFYTAPSLVASDLRSHAPHAQPTALPLAEQNGIMRCRTPSPPSAAQSVPTAVCNDDAPAVLAVEVEALEREADAIQARLQRSAQTKPQQRRRSRRSTRSPSSVDTSSSSSSSDAASEITSEQRRQRHRRRSTTTERRLTRTLHKELERVRAEQQRSLKQMQRDVREALDEVVSVATAAAETAASSCSRASSRDSHTRVEREAGVREGLRGSRSSSSSRPAEADEEEEKRTPEVRLEAKAGAGGASLSPHHQQQQCHHSALVHPVRQTSEAETEELRASLAAAEARAARLEQQSIQLKKRLWLAEELSDVSAATAVAAPPERDRQHVSLRNAFIYGDVSAPLQETREAKGNNESGPFMTDARGAQVEEEALLYLVDRALSERRAQRGGALCREDWRRVKHTLPSTAGPPLAAAAMKTTATPAVSAADSSSPLKCFDDGVENAWGLQQRVPASGRSPLIRQQRASIFERLRRSSTTPAAVVLRPPSSVAKESDGAAAARAPLTHEGNGLSPQTAAPREDGEDGGRSAQLDPSPSSPPPQMPLHPYSSSSSSQSKAFAPAPVRPSLDGSRRGAKAASSSSSYYDTISHTDRTASNAAHYAGEEKSGSALRARQVLQNARRLLQSRGDGTTLRGGAVNGGVSYGEEEFSGSQVSGPSGRYVGESGERCHPSFFSSSPSAAHATEQGSSAAYSPLTPPPPYASLLNTTPAASSTAATTTAAAVVAAHHASPPPPQLQRLADTRFNTHVQLRSEHDDFQGSRGGVYGDAGALRSPSAEMRPFTYDASPYAAVDYTTSKLPRPSMHVEREAFSVNINRSSAISVVGRAPDMRRVDSATSPVAAPRSRSRRSRLEEYEEEESDTSSSGGSGASDPHVPLPRRGQSMPSQSRKHDGPHQKARVHARRSFTSSPVNQREASYSASENKEGVRRPIVVGTHRHHSPSPRVRRSGSSSSSRQDAWQHQMVSRASSKASSSSSSRGSAQADLLDTLTQQESLLRRALTQLQTQQRQLAEKRREVAQVAAAKGLHVQSGYSSAGARGGRGKSASTGQAASPQLRKVVELLNRLTAAEGMLASKVDRVEEAVATVQRQRSALVSDDFL